MRGIQANSSGGGARSFIVLAVASLGGLLAFLYPFVIPGIAQAQTDYYNTDAGRPLRVEDAAALERRGFEHEDIFLVGLNALRLRMTGYLPSLVSGTTPFAGTSAISRPRSLPRYRGARGRCRPAA